MLIFLFDQCVVSTTLPFSSILFIPIASINVYRVENLCYIFYKKASARWHLPRVHAPKRRSKKETNQRRKECIYILSLKEDPSFSCLMMMQVICISVYVMWCVSWVCSTLEIYIIFIGFIYYYWNERIWWTLEAECEKNKTCILRQVFALKICRLSFYKSILNDFLDY